MIGQLLDGRYKIISTLSAGGFGETYMAEDTRIPGNPKCVVKHLKPASNDPNLLPTARRLFQSEAETLAQIGNHDQIPRLLAYFEENQQFYLVQEYIEGQTLAEELTPGKRLSESYVIALLKGLLPVLDFIHQQQVIHRDIKPANIIRRRQDGKLVLIDFGAVKQVRSHLISMHNTTAATVAIGTPGYMSIEQGRGQPRPSSDIYALGMIAIQALTGFYPQDIDEDPQTGELLWQRHVSVSPKLADILTRMVRYHFKDRYHSAIDVLQVLQAIAIPFTSENQPIPVATPNEQQWQELTLEWMEQGQLKTRTINDKQASKNPGTVRIGRDWQQCDVVLLEPTISALHVEIFFNRGQQRFYVRNLRDSNPPLVNGQPLVTGEVPLSPGSTLQLGQQELKVSSIRVQNYPAGYQPTEYATQAVVGRGTPVAPTVQPAQPETTSIPAPTPHRQAEPIASPPVSRPRNNMPFVVGIGIVALGAIAAIIAKAFPDAIEVPFFADRSCAATILASNETKGNNVRKEPSKYGPIIPELSGKSKRTELKTTGKKAAYSNLPNVWWFEVKNPSGGNAWVHQSVIDDYRSLESCLQKKRILQRVNAATYVTSLSAPPQPKPTPKPTQTLQPQPLVTTQPQTPQPQTPQPTTPINTAYEDGLRAGVAHGRKVGEQDGTASGGQGEPVPTTCDISTGGPNYNSGFKVGCEEQYRAAFIAAREKVRQQNETQGQSEAQAQCTAAGKVWENGECRQSAPQPEPPKEPQPEPPKEPQIQDQAQCEQAGRTWANEQCIAPTEPKQ